MNSLRALQRRLPGASVGNQTVADNRLTFQHIAQLSNGVWLRAPRQLDESVGGVTDDTRCIRRDWAFLAIPGQYTDGHRFLEQAVEAGASLLVVQEVPGNRLIHADESRRGAAILLVDDTMRAFHQLAEAHRLRFPDLRMVALTGSNGKTSTKEILASILEQRWAGRVLKTVGNTNNFFGVPRNLLRLSAHHRAAVLELGTNAPGEIVRLGRIVHPEVGIVTNIGHAHLEKLGDLTGVAGEKSSLLTCLEGDGIAVIPAEGPGLEKLRQAADRRRILTFACGCDADVRTEYLGVSGDRYAIRLVWREPAEEVVLQWPCAGAHQACNAAAAAAACEALGLPRDVVVEGMRRVKPPRMRFQHIDIGGVNWVNDAYNANPDSARAGIDAFLEVVSSQGNVAEIVLVLGDMRELGERAARSHAELLAWARNRCPECRIIGVGEAMKVAARETGESGFTESREAGAALKKVVKAGGWVYVKGSRGVGLETILRQWPEDQRGEAGA